MPESGHSGTPTPDSNDTSSSCGISAVFTASTRRISVRFIPDILPSVSGFESALKVQVLPVIGVRYCSGSLSVLAAFQYCSNTH